MSTAPGTRAGTATGGLAEQLNCQSQSSLTKSKPQITKTLQSSSSLLHLLGERRCLTSLLFHLLYITNHWIYYEFPNSEHIFPKMGIRAELSLTMRVLSQKIIGLLRVNMGNGPGKSLTFNLLPLIRSAAFGARPRFLLAKSRRRSASRLVSRLAPDLRQLGSFGPTGRSVFSRLVLFQQSLTPR